METPFKPSHRCWRSKLQNAFRGVWIAVGRHPSFWVHGGAALAVVAAATLLRLEAWQWSALVLCITVVFVAETLNTSIEHLAKATCPDFNPHVRDALDIGSGAVLVASFGAVAVGVIVLLS